MNRFGSSMIMLGAMLLVSSSVLAEPPVNQYLPPDQLYGPPNVQHKPPISGGNSHPGGQFGQTSNFGSNQYLPPNQQYGAPGAGISGGYGSGYDDSSNSAPAKYEFEYTVNDPPSGNDFGHKESRDGDFTKGIYFVLLPDGRRQMVEYEADQDGYRPKVTYIQTGSGSSGSGGYPSGALGGYPGSGSAGGYPGSGSAGGYPGSGSAGGYPGISAGGYPSGPSDFSSGGAGGYPSGGQSGYRY